MIDNILGNKTNILILRFLTRFNNQFFPAEEIAKETGAGLRNVYDSLNVLSHEKILDKRVSSGKIHYKFAVDSKFKGLVYQLFEEEKNKFFLQTTQIYKVVSEIESKIIKIVGSNLIDIFLFGSIAKGRDTINSDIDLCILVGKKDPRLEQQIRTLSFENKFKKGIQIHLFTSKEFLAAEKSGNPLIKSIMRDGLSLRIGK